MNRFEYNGEADTKTDNAGVGKSQVPRHTNKKSVRKQEGRKEEGKGQRNDNEGKRRKTENKCAETEARETGKHPDTTSITLICVYAPCIADNHDEGTTVAKLKTFNAELTSCIEAAKKAYGANAPLVIGGDFNRVDPTANDGAPYPFEMKGIENTYKLLEEHHATDVMRLIHPHEPLRTSLPPKEEIGHKSFCPDGYRKPGQQLPGGRNIDRIFTAGRTTTTDANITSIPLLVGAKHRAVTITFHCHEHSFPPNIDTANTKPKDHPMVGRQQTFSPTRVQSQHFATVSCPRFLSMTP